MLQDYSKLHSVAPYYTPTIKNYLIIIQKTIQSIKIERVQYKSTTAMKLHV